MTFGTVQVGMRTGSRDGERIEVERTGHKQGNKEG